MTVSTAPSSDDAQKYRQERHRGGKAHARAAKDGQRPIRAELLKHGERRDDQAIQKTDRYWQKGSADHGLPKHGFWTERDTRKEWKDPGPAPMIKDITQSTTGSRERRSNHK
ncbi:hypothetical protein AYO20_05650 [Fonsecaea nubica]|uniref:Uncharacterized protein n=1 Tax=Fonsecaea nubica TaxID=856822 RepID=A0A178D1B2_9EURO|nr:hypothetical protein AYO20_05650 [Fonsecaea nubica]OAL35173.1 hypothetical protein AYO20_05650 [Fonsecaea nubica]